MPPRVRPDPSAVEAANANSLDDARSLARRRRSPGFIAGVTNPRYEDMERWWDVLCNVATGTIKFASHLPPQTTTEPHVAIDTEFIADVGSACSGQAGASRGGGVAHHGRGPLCRRPCSACAGWQVMAAIQAHQSEDRVRAKFQDYVQNIVDIAFDDAEFPDDATRRKVGRQGCGTPGGPLSLVPHADHH